MLWGLINQNQNYQNNEPVKTISQKLDSKYIEYSFKKRGKYFEDRGNWSLSKNPLKLKISRNLEDGSAILEVEIPHSHYYSHNVDNGIKINGNWLPLEKFITSDKKLQGWKKYKITHNGNNEKLYFEDIKSVYFYQTCRFTRLTFGTINFEIKNPCGEMTIENKDAKNNKIRYSYLYEINYQISYDSIRIGNISTDRKSNAYFLEGEIETYLPSQNKPTNTFAKITYNAFALHDHKKISLNEKVCDLLKFNTLHLIDNKLNVFNLVKEVKKVDEFKVITNFNLDKKFNYDKRTKNWNENSNGVLGYYLPATFKGNVKSNFELINKFDSKLGTTTLIDINKDFSNPLFDYENGIVKLNVKIQKLKDWKNKENNNKFDWKTQKI